MTTYSRDNILSILDDEFSVIAQASGISATDTPKNYKSIIDNTLIDMGVDRSNLNAEYTPTTPKDEDKLIAVAKYQALKKFVQNLTISVDITAGTPSIAKQRSQMYKQVKEMRDEAAAAAGNLGGTVKDDVTVGWFMYNYLTPVSTDEFAG